MFLKFEKWHGAKNDFLVTWISDLDGDTVLQSLKRQAVKFCDRHTGVGGDGVLILTTRKRDDRLPYRLTIVNSDGSVAKNCGNGIRCAASSVLKAHRDHPGDGLPEVVELEVDGAPMVARFLGKGGAQPFVAVEMGVPWLGGDVAWEAEAKRAVAEVGKRLGVPDLGADVAVCEIGNPHIVVTTEKASRDLVLKVGPALQSGHSWDGMNVHLVKPLAIDAKDQARAGHELGQALSEGATAYVWERGAGETMACGSGACAIAAAALGSGLVDRDAWYAVEMPGGRLYVKQDASDEPAVLAGPAHFVFAGTVEI